MNKIKECFPFGKRSKTMRNVEDDFSMEDFESMLNASFQKVYNGDILDGKVVEVGPEGLLVDVHSNMDGFLPVEELFAGDSLDNYHEGDTIKVMVKHVDTRDGGIITLSKKAADTAGVWEDMSGAQDAQKVIDVKVLRAVKGGLVVSYKGGEGFMPVSQITTEYVEDTSSYVGKTLTALITEVDPDRQRFVCSHKVIAMTEEKLAREAKMASLQVGTVLTGKVTKLMPFGAFVELAPRMEGLIHVSELSWKRVKSPAEVVKIGEIVKVKVLKVDLEKNRISLSLKENDADPWLNMSFKAGQIVPATILSLIDSGAFAQIEEGLEGFIHISNISEKRVTRVSSALQVGQNVMVKILSIDEEQKRISLSIKAASEDAAAAEKEEILKGYQPDDSDVTTNLGSLLSGFMHKK